MADGGTSRAAAFSVGASTDAPSPTARVEISAYEVLERLPISVLVVRADGRVTLASDAARETLNLVDSVEGTPVDTLLAPLETLLDTRRADNSVSVYSGGGQVKRFGYSIANITRPSAPSQLFAIVFRDITDRAHVAPERDRLVQLAAVGAAAPAVIHEVKNSLAAITMGLGLIAEELEGEDTGAHAAALADEAESVAYRLDAFGSVARPPRSRRPINLDRTISEARRSLEAKSRSEGVHLDWHIGRLVPVYLDPGLVHAFALNLATNAIHASAEGQRVRVAIAVEGDAFVMKVEDEGTGMTPEVLAQCTELFFTTRGRGRGIGLTLCNEAVRAGGGTLEIESTRGEGTHVTVTIPRATEFER